MIHIFEHGMWDVGVRGKGERKGKWWWGRMDAEWVPTENYWVRMQNLKKQLRSRSS